MYIYGLREPGKTGLADTRYVGKAVDLQKRLKGHLKIRPGSHKSNWIALLLNRRALPEIFILEEVATGERWQSREQYWIARLREIGADLTNATDGGEGWHNPAEWLRKRQSELMKGRYVGKKHSAVSREHMRQAHLGKKYPLGRAGYWRGKTGPMKGRRQSDEARMKMREAWKNPNRIIGKGFLGKHHDEHFKQIMSQRMIGHIVTAETRAKISLANTGRTGQVAWNKGKKTDPEVLTRLSATRKGRTPWNKGIAVSEEQKMKISAKNKGRKLTEEQKAKIGVASKQMWERRRCQTVQQ